MVDNRTSKRIGNWKPIGRRIRGRPRKRWMYEVKNDVRGVNVVGWRRLPGERTERKRNLEQATLRSTSSCGGVTRSRCWERRGIRLVSGNDETSFCGRGR